MKRKKNSLRKEVKKEKKELTRRGIEPGPYKMHEFLQVDLCEFLPVAFATKNLARALKLRGVGKVRVRFPDVTFFFPFFPSFTRLRTECMSFCDFLLLELAWFY